MPIISEAEARALLSRPLRCEGDLEWKLQQDRPPARMLAAGIIDDAGRGTHLVVELKYACSATQTKYVFSVVIVERYSTDRVYQLEVNHARRKPKDAHAISHEHIGDRRQIGQAGWKYWSYDEVLAYFCAQTNITFTPSPPCP